VIISLISTLLVSFRSRIALQAEILALRHQLAVLRRTKPRRIPLRTVDRLLWVILGRFWPEWHAALMLVKPDTVIGWHRRGFRFYWKWESRRGRIGRPGMSMEVRDLIGKMSASNVLWGAPCLPPSGACGARSGFGYSSSCARLPDDEPG
jgi:putative transposase